MNSNRPPAAALNISGCSFGRAILRGLQLALLSGITLLPTKLLAQDYLLGSQDRVKIRVYEWRPVTASNFEWTPLTGDFVVSAAGTLSLPIIGTIPAAGMSADDLAATIGERLQKEIGLQKRPSASVEISEYRPFFITGLVSKPGKFSYLPDLTVIQALSMAGGTSGVVDADILGVQREALRHRGELRSLQAEQISLLARRARLQAMIDGQEKIAFPSELSRRTNEAAIDRILRAEQTQFSASRRAMQTERDSLQQAQAFATNQIGALQEKAASLKQQVALASKELANVSKLVSDGLSVSARRIGASQNLSELESRSLDVSLATMTAQQDKVRIERDLANVDDKYRIEALEQDTEVRDRLAVNAEKLATSTAILQNLQLSAPAAVTIAQFEPENPLVISIDRIIEGTPRRLFVTENESVFPGDIIRVERERITSTKSAGASPEGAGAEAVLQ